MLPTAGRLPTAPGWAYELKWDGIRAITGVRDGIMVIQSRRGRDITDRFPELAGITRTLNDVVLDGEIVVFEGSHPDFGATISRMQTRPSRAVAIAASKPATMLVFDILRLDGENLRRLPYGERRDLLEALPLDGDPWAVPPRFDNAQATVETSLEFGLEGVVAKRLSSPYVSGRSRQWIKLRHTPVIDAVVIGWSRRGPEVSLLLAEATSTGLVYIGRCRAPLQLLDDLAPLAATAPAVAVPASTSAQWVRPALQVEVVASSRLPDGRLRHPKFKRLRPDL
jgi:bifunctional non-homologous end joining protein LigD